jgi:hypothetical protein
MVQEPAWVGETVFADFRRGFVFFRVFGVSTIMVVIHLVRLLPLSACALAACTGGRTSLLRVTASDAAAVAKDARLEARDSARVRPADVRPDLAPDFPPDFPPDLGPDLGPDLRPDVSREVSPDLPPDLPLPPSPDLAVSVDTAPPIVVPGCAPASETCNGKDDDCDGVVDNDIPPVPCPGGGFRYCMGGQMSDCPTRCSVCVPGGQRVCFISYCTFWGRQTCAADGQSWGYCVEQRPVPSVCAKVANDKKHSPLTEQCCIDNGFCCLDEFDLNGNGDKTEMLGRCEDVLCAVR